MAQSAGHPPHRHDHRTDAQPTQEHVALPALGTGQRPQDETAADRCAQHQRRGGARNAQGARDHRREIGGARELDVDTVDGGHASHAGDAAQRGERSQRPAPGTPPRP
jgi:hypothetical protein